MITPLIIIYLVSVIEAYKIKQKLETNYSKSDFIIILFPIINTFHCIIGILIFLGNFLDKIDWNKFFNKW